MLFMRLLVEKNRHIISLHKALGFTGAELKVAWFIKGLLPVAAGICLGVVGGNPLGEGLCGMVLQSFGAASFRFVVGWGRILAGIPILLGPAIVAIFMGISEISRIKAYECCAGKE